MATRRRGTKPGAGATPIATPPVDSLETRVVAFAEELGRIAGIVRGKTDGWLDRDALTQQLATVRDSASGLLEHLVATGTASPAAKPAAVSKAGRPAAGRGGGKVDAPGKKHRKPAPPDPGLLTAVSQSAKMRLARPMAKTNRRRARG